MAFGISCDITAVFAGGTGTAVGPAASTSIGASKTAARIASRIKIFCIVELRDIPRPAHSMHLKWVVDLNQPRSPRTSGIATPVWSMPRPPVSTAAGSSQNDRYLAQSNAKPDQ
jgi:hypothetical protein